MNSDWSSVKHQLQPKVFSKSTPSTPGRKAGSALVVSSAVLLALVAALTLATRPVVSFAQHPRLLAGQWSFNESQSDDAGQKVHDAEQSARRERSNSPRGGYPGGDPGAGGGYPGGGVGFPGRVGVGFPGGGGMGRGRRGPMGRSQRRPSQNLEPLAENPKALTITQNGNEVTLIDNDGQTLTLAGDGKKHKEKDSNGKKFTIKSHWEGSSLISERKLNGLGKFKVTYELNPEHTQLIVISRLDDSQLSSPLVIRRVFDRASSVESK